MAGEAEKPVIERLKWGTYNHGSGVYRLTNNHGFFAHTITVVVDLLGLASRGLEVSRLDLRGCYTLYRDTPDQDVYADFYQQDLDVRIAGSVAAEGILGGFARFEHVNKIRFADLPFAAAGKVIEKFFRFAPPVSERASELAAQLGFDPRQTICIYYRATDKAREMELASVDQFMDVADKILERLPDHRVLIQSDDQRVMNILKSCYGNRSIIVPGVPASVKGNPAHRGKEQGRMAGLRPFISAWLLMLRCSHIVCATSNVSMAMALYRGSARNMVVFHHADTMFDYT
jgi:hypothetical protein